MSAPSKARFGRVQRTVAVVAMSIIGIGVTVFADRTSASRANRLHRADALEEAAAIYRERVSVDPESERLRYNLGTTLLRMGEVGAFEELAIGSSSESEPLRVRSFYNIGLWQLIQSISALTVDSVLVHAQSAIESNKAALRLDPDHADAQWNLALAQRIVETSRLEQALMDPGDLSGPDNIGERTENSMPMNLTGQDGQIDVNAAAENETLAADSLLLPLTEAEASGLLGTTHLDPTRLMTRMFRRESRERRADGYIGQRAIW